MLSTWPLDNNLVADKPDEDTEEHSDVEDGVDVEPLVVAPSFSC